MPTKFSFPTSAASGSPAVSVIIPLYDSEKYIGECLDSLLAQTFQNFEVIVVDDCSTDNSAAIVQSYSGKFGERLTLSHRKKNSGGAGLPRNKGIELSRGEYVCFIDPDDTIKSTALEELYALAKNYDADVVHCEKYYEIPDEFYNDTEYRKNLKPSSCPSKGRIFITEPTLLTNDFEQRAVDFLNKWLTWSVCVQFIRRNVIVDNEIKFANVYAEDLVFTMCMLCCAEKYLVVPNVLYYYRLRDGSAVREPFDVPQMIHKYSTTAMYAINTLDDFFDGHKIFSGNVELKYAFFDMFMNEILNRLNKIYAQVPAPALDELLRKEFSVGNNIALTTFIFNLMNVQRLQMNQIIVQANQRIAELEDELKRFKE